MHPAGQHLPHPLGHPRHDPPSQNNSHPLASDKGYKFTVVYNGIITNYKLLKDFLIKHGETFATDTDTEVIPKLCKFVYERITVKVPFPKLVMDVLNKLEGAYAVQIKSAHYPGELIACKRGSTMILGIKSLTLHHPTLDYNNEDNNREESYREALCLCDMALKLLYAFQAPSGGPDPLQGASPGLQVRQGGVVLEERIQGVLVPEPPTTLSRSASLDYVLSHALFLSLLAQEAVQQLPQQPNSQPKKPASSCLDTFGSFHKNLGYSCTNSPAPDQRSQPAAASIVLPPYPRSQQEATP
eukprot:gene26744-4314_t